MSQETRLVTVHEVAARLGQTEQTIRRKVRAGELPGVRIGQGPRAPLRVPSGFLDAWLYAAPSEERGR